MTISGQKQVSPCPAGKKTRGNCGEDGALEILKEATTVSREQILEEATVFLLRDVNRRVPSKKCSYAMAPKHE